MSEAIKEQILAAEEQLRVAMLGSDVSVLDELLAPELVFKIGRASCRERV